MDKSTAVGLWQGRSVDVSIQQAVYAFPYLNARPLTYGLEQSSDVVVRRGAPAAMARALASGQANAALLPVADLARLAGRVTVLPAGCIACAGPTLTARIFSRVPPREITHLWADSNSSTATALAKILWRVNYSRRLSVIPFDAALVEPPADAQACLVKGDRVVADPPFGYDWQLDLGAMWFEMTGLPMVFAVWAADDAADQAGLFKMLSESRRQGQEHLVEIAHKLGPSYGWPEDLAERYLTRYLQLEFTEACRDGLHEFLDLAVEMEIMDQHAPVRLHSM
jgi:chorismate dehydratase